MTLRNDSVRSKQLMATVSIMALWGCREQTCSVGNDVEEGEPTAGAELMELDGECRAGRELGACTKGLRVGWYELIGT